MHIRGWLNGLLNNEESHYLIGDSKVYYKWWDKFSNPIEHKTCGKFWTNCKGKHVESCGNLSFMNSSMQSKNLHEQSKLGNRERRYVMVLSHNCFPILLVNMCAYGLRIWLPQITRSSRHHDGNTSNQMCER